MSLSPTYSTRVSLYNPNTPATTKASAAFPSAASQRAHSLAAMRAPPHIVFCCACTAVLENSAGQAQISAKRAMAYCVEGSKGGRGVKQKWGKRKKSAGKWSKGKRGYARKTINVCLSHITNYHGKRPQHSVCLSRAGESTLSR